MSRPTVTSGIGSRLSVVAARERRQDIVVEKPVGAHRVATVGPGVPAEDPVKRPPASSTITWTAAGPRVGGRRPDGDVDRTVGDKTWDQKSPKKQGASTGQPARNSAATDLIERTHRSYLRWASPMRATVETPTGSPLQRTAADG
jgi:hypothetical protein